MKLQIDSGLEHIIYVDVIEVSDNLNIGDVSLLLDTFSDRFENLSMKELSVCPNCKSVL